MISYRNENNSLKELIIREIEVLSESPQIRVLIFVHRQGDPDALCAASALSRLIETWFVSDSNEASKIETKIIAPQRVSLLGARVCDRLNISYHEEISEQELLKANLILALDVGEMGLLEPYEKYVRDSSAKKILIDHHSRGDDIQEYWDNFDVGFVRKEATSTCEILVLGVPSKDIDRETAQTLLVGVFFDSQHLGIATESTLEAALALVKRGAQIESAKELLKSRPDRSEIIARIKAAQRSKQIEIGNYQIIITEVSSFHASVARMLIEIGADVGIAYGKNENEGRLSVRSTSQFFKETRIDMGTLLDRLAKDKGLTGGGHPTAASISGAMPSSELANAVMSSLKRALP